MGSSVRLCAVLGLWITFQCKMRITTTPPRNFAFLGDYLWINLCSFLQGHSLCVVDCTFRHSLLLVGLFYSPFFYTHYSLIWMAICTSSSCFWETVVGASIIRSWAFLFMGKVMTSRMDSSPVKSMISRSTPGAAPAWGGAP